MAKYKTLIIILIMTVTICKGQNALLIPDTLGGTNVSLTLQNGVHQFYSGQNTNTMGANGDVLAPTLILKKGDFVNFSVDNQLSDTTTIHWHGLHVAPENDGGPHTVILPNDTWTPSFTIMDKAATFWYHPHLHHKTNEHVSKGIAGLIIVRDTLEQNLALPRTYGVDDIPLIIQTKDFDSDNQIVVHSNSDDIVMVNATIDPYIDIPAQVVRLRILNGSSQRTFNLGLSNNQSFYQIASDGGLLVEPFQTTRLLISPGERAELLVDLTGLNGQNIQLKSYASELPNGIYGATNPGMAPPMTLSGYNPNPLNGNDFDVLNFNIIGQNNNPITAIPTNLVSVNPWAETDAMVTRNLTFSPQNMGPNQLNGNFLINNVSFDMNTINYTISLDNIEIWELTNQSGIAHPFHIHDVQFNILSRNGATPPANERGWKDVVLVKPMETVRFITKFEDFSNNDIPYMYHCHLLTHEDDGMMGQFIVSNPVSSVLNPTNENLINIYPNPSWGTIIIENDNSIKQIFIMDILGREIKRQIVETEHKTIIENLPKGVLFISVHVENKWITKKIITK